MGIKRLFIFFNLTMLTCSAMAVDIEEMIIRFEADRGALMRKYTVRLSDEYFNRMERFYGEWSDELEKIDFASLPPEEKVDYHLLKNLVNKSAYFLQQDQNKFQEVKSVVDFAEPLYDFIVERRSGTKPDAGATAEVFSGAIKSIAAKQKNLSEKPFPNWQQADKASQVVVSLKRNLKEAYGFYYGYDPEFTWWVAKSYDSLDVVLNNYAKFLEGNYVNTSVKDDGSGIIGKPIGKDEIIQRLRFEFILYSPEELIQVAETQFAWCEREMLKASREMGFGENWKAALEKVKNSYVPEGEQPGLIDSLAWQAIRFVEEKDILTVPSLAKETWRMEMMSPERQKVNPFFTGGEVISISYPTHTMEHDDKMMSMRGNNPHFSKATVHHELIPGHHMQQFMNSRYNSYRNVFSTPFWIEGWALYWELNLWDKGFAASPEDRVGMLFWRMHRCARIIFSLNYHLGKMTPQQCIDFLVDRVGHEYANAEAEVRRSFTGDYGPLYQIAYMIGGLQFYALQKELVGSGKLTEKQFHDRILKEGNIPVDMVRLLFSEAETKKDYSTKWRFLEKISFN